MFPIAPSNASSEKLAELVQGIRLLLDHPAQPLMGVSASPSTADDNETRQTAEKHSARENERLQRIIETLKEELGEFPSFAPLKGMHS